MCSKVAAVCSFSNQASGDGVTMAHSQKARGAVGVLSTAANTVRRL
jgi:hypothetical protein